LIGIAGSSDKKRKLADEAYDLTDENFLVDVPEKLSTFRLVDLLITLG